MLDNHKLAATRRGNATFAFTLLGAGLGIFPSCRNGQTADERPNILFILSDDHTSQAWGIYGGILEPYVMHHNISRLAREGVVLDNCFCTNSISVPSRATILTGQYSHRNGVYTLEDALCPGQDNIAKRLNESGYQTALIGKWHLKKQPSGFDYFSVFHDQGDYWDPAFKTATDWMDDHEGMGGVREAGFSTDIVTDKTIEWIAARDRDRPFMMMCHFKATHEPWEFPDRMKELYEDVVFPEPANLYEFGPEHSGRTFTGQQLENLGMRWEKASQGPGSWWTNYPELPFDTEGMDEHEARSAIYQKLVRDYLRCGATIDDNIGRLLDYLDSEGLFRNTIVVYVSDQGYFLGEHGFFDKRIMYEESLRMPMVVRYPGEIPPGTRNGDIITNVDFAATLADYARTSAPQGNQGRSFRTNLRGETPADWPRAMYYRYWTQHEIRPAHLGIRTHRYKLIFFYGDKLHSAGSDNTVTEPGWEFYDLESDPQENQNAYNDPAYQSVISSLKADLIRLRSQTGDTDPDSERMQQIMENSFW